MREIILKKLEQIEKDYNITILFAVESGSRAWGFASEDSDYDIRFIYKHSTDTYLNLWGHSNNICIMDVEFDLDFVGWDIGKAIKLLCKPNPTLIEWLKSPVQYKYDPVIFNKLMDIAQHTQYRRAMLFHYCSMGKNAYNDKKFTIKKYLYAIRSAVVIQFLRNNEYGFPPVNINNLITAAKLYPIIRDSIFNVVNEKKKMVEKESVFTHYRYLDVFIEAQFDYVDGITIKKIPCTVEGEADRLFKEIIK